MNPTSSPSWNDFSDGLPSVSTDSKSSASQAVSLPDKGLTYSNALLKGKILLTMMQADDRTAGQMFREARPSAESQFLSPTALQTWGYNRSNPSFDELKNLGSLLADLEIDINNVQGSGLDIEVFDQHIHATTHGGMLVPSTNAKFCTLVNWQNGLLVATQSYGPDFKTSHVEAKPMLPNLQHWSDVAFLQWLAPQLPENQTEHDQEEVAELKYVLRYRIENSDTKAIVEHLYGETGTSDGPSRLLWPGVTFHMDDDRGKAFLGTPNGSGVAWLLIQHKKQLGHKTVDKITLYCKDEEDAWSRRDPCLLFYLKDVTMEHNW